MAFFLQEQNLIQRISKLFFSMCKQQILKNSPNCFSSGKTLTINWTKHKPKYIWKMHFHFLNKVFFYIYTMIQKQFRKNWKLKKKKLKISTYFTPDGDGSWYFFLWVTFIGGFRVTWLIRKFIRISSQLLTLSTYSIKLGDNLVENRSS